MTIPRGRQAYSRVSSDSNEQHTTAAASADGEETRLPASRTALLNDDEHDQSTQDAAESSTLENRTADELLEDDGNPLTVVILDPAHTRFSVSVKTTATIADLKREGSKVHRVPAKSQRLIYMGRLLKDDDTLKDSGVVDDDTLIHLFPKPRVVVASSSAALEATAASERQDDDDSSSTSGAHVPQIILDPDEAAGRSSILVLGSDEIIEAQNNVKLLSFLLLIISSMELLALFTIFLGVPQDDGLPHDDPGHNQTHGNETNSNDFWVFHSDDDGGTFFPNHDDVVMRTWQTSDYFDLAISALGFYVATLGIKATTENTLRLAKMYLYGTVVVSVCWTTFYFLMNVQAERQADQERIEENDDDFPPLENSDLYGQALIAVMLPALIWSLCCIRAWQFQILLQDAEREAEERIRNEISDLEQGGATIVNASSRQPATSTNPAANQAENQELTLQNESATII